MPAAIDAFRQDFPSLRFETPADGVIEVIIAHEGRQNSATEMSASKATASPAPTAVPRIAETTGLLQFTRL